MKTLRTHCLWLFVTFLASSGLHAQDDSLIYYFNHFSDPVAAKAEHLLPKLSAADSSRISDIATHISRKEFRVKFYDLLGDRFYDVDDYENAKLYYSRALFVAKLTLNKELVAQELCSIGDMHRLQDQNTVALSYLFQAMYIFKELKNTEHLSHTLALIGDIHRCIQQYDDALKYLYEGLQLAKQNKDRGEQSFCYSSLGATLQAMEKYNQAFEAYSKGLSLVEITDTSRSIDLLYSIGDLLVEEGKTSLALDYLNRAVELSVFSNDQYHLAFSHLGIARAYLAEKKYQQAVDEAMICYNLGISLKASGFCAEAAAELYVAYEALGDYRNAYHYLKIVKDDNDSTISSEQIKKQAVMELNFQNSFKEKQDSLLRASQERQRDLEHEAELGRQKIVTASGIAAFLVVMIIAIIVYRNYKRTQRSSEIINKQKALVDTKNKEILDSINYAKKIQQAIIPTHTELLNVFPESFVLLLPKDIVSGDFYWVVRSGQQAFFAVADCTGHGVPGGFMSMLGTALLNEIINEKKIYEPADILDMLKLKIVLALRQNESTYENRDGMDIALFRLDLNLYELTYAGANNSLYLLRDKQLTEIKGTKAPVGYTEIRNSQFSQQKMMLRKGDQLYMFTDGYPDQFGGPQGKKFKYKRLENLLVEIGALPMDEQRKQLLQHLENWKGELEQVDDICIAGIRI